VLPEAPLKLLFIIDCQKQHQAFQLYGADAADILFYQIDQQVYKEDPSADPPEVDDLGPRAEILAEAIKFAIKCWAGKQEALAAVVALPSLPDIVAACIQWHGGDPSCELFNPVTFSGRGMTVGNAPRRLPNLTAERIAHFTVPALFMGGEVQCEAFGIPLLLMLPENAVAGQKVELRLVEGVVETTLMGMTAIIARVEQPMAMASGHNANQSAGVA
jgi:hypothetical protein